MHWTPKPPEVAEIEAAQRDHQLTLRLHAQGKASREDCANACSDIYLVARKHGYFIGVTESAFWRWQPWMEEFRDKK